MIKTGARQPAKVSAGVIVTVGQVEARLPITGIEEVRRQTLIVQIVTKDDTVEPDTLSVTQTVLNEAEC